MPHIQDPLTKEIAMLPLCLINQRPTVGTPHTGELTILFKGDLRKRFIKDPQRLQGHPFLLHGDVLKIGQIKVDHITEWIVADDSLTVGCSWEQIETLNSFKEVQHQRWLYDDNG